MTFPQRIELNTATDRALSTGAWLTWLTAGCNLVLHAPRIADWLLAICGLLLIGSFPAARSSSSQPGQLVLQADGRALWGETQGVWLPGGWRIRRYCVIRFQSGKNRSMIWVSSNHNLAADWRHLAIWLRFPPQQTSQA